MPYKLVCKGCYTEFFPHWYKAQEEKCPQCSSTELGMKRVEQKNFLNELNKKAEKSFSSKGGG